MHISDFDYDLPPELIAREPVRPRDASRMMVVHARTGELVDTEFRKLPELLEPSDVLVINDTRVLRARIQGKLVRASGGTRDVEILFAAPLSADTWEVMCKPGKRIRPGDRVLLGSPHRVAVGGPRSPSGLSGRASSHERSECKPARSVSATARNLKNRAQPSRESARGEGMLEGVFGSLREHGLRELQLFGPRHLSDFLERHGHVPLPPYIDRADTPEDAVEYQTIFAREPGAVAAPTAGLHFTPAVLDALKSRGVEILTITLHVGVGTFIPVRADDPRKHVLKPERFELSAATADRLNAARDANRRIVAVGTTSTRTLEHVLGRYGRFQPYSGEADLYILPGYQFRAVGAMLTNFHLPRSTLIMLVSAFASREVILKAYGHAIANRYRFYSYGDCMLLVR